MKSDKAIEEIRKVRKEISAEFDNDPKKLIEHYIELQDQYKERLIKKQTSEKEEGDLKVA
ncbi:MAG TPA: hypothetical protein VGO50_11645 [Pyrinomonadaceae bacterium]|jgi:hypothetical protein|nr:hypothetical protein [Pyrinomonadaceae bacterium]